MKSFLPDAIRTLRPLLFLATGLLALVPACSRNSEPGLPVLSDPPAGLTVTLPPTATSLQRSPTRDRFVSRTPYAPNQSLLYLHFYSPPLVEPTAPPDFHDDIVEAILRDELGTFLTLDTTYTNLTDHTPAVVIFGRARDPDKVVGFAFQCNKTHLIFIGLSGPELTRADADTFFHTLLPTLRIADVHQTTAIDAATYQSHLVSFDDPAQSLVFIRNLFASRNTNPVNYTIGIHLAFRLAQYLQSTSPDSPRLAETLALLNNMNAIRLADYLKARRDFEIAAGQKNGPETRAQARFLSDLSFAFDSESQALARRRLRRALSLP